MLVLEIGILFGDILILLSQDIVDLENIVDLEKTRNKYGKKYIDKFAGDVFDTSISQLKIYMLI